MQFQEKTIPAPLGKSLEIPKGRGILKVKIIEAKYYEAKLEFPGGTGVQNKIPSVGGGMDIFWNCTMSYS